MNKPNSLQTECCDYMKLNLLQISWYVIEQLECEIAKTFVREKIFRFIKLRLLTVANFALM